MTIASSSASSTQPELENDILQPAQIVRSFQTNVIHRFRVPLSGTTYDYPTYLTTPRTGDEANAVDMLFTPLVLEWLGFTASDWTYNQTIPGQRINRPDFVVHGTVGWAFIWENKNTSESFEQKHLVQMGRYSAGSAGYAVWCNLRRIIAGRFHTHDTLHFETLADIHVARLFHEHPTDEEIEAQGTQLALFKLLFSKRRFTHFTELLNRIAIPEELFLERAISLEDHATLNTFITGSRMALSHLHLAAFARIQESLNTQQKFRDEEEMLQQEWQEACERLIQQVSFHRTAADDPYRENIQPIMRHLTPRLGYLIPTDFQSVEHALQTVTGSLSLSLRGYLNNWMERATRINAAMASLRFHTKGLAIAESYQIWSERQSDPEDVQPDIYAEQVAYVLFIRLLLVRVLEDKRMITPRLASDGGFLDWISYVARNFAELKDIGVLHEQYYDLLSRKAGRYYLHFFQQEVFDWFVPDDFLLVETLDFLCQYHFAHINSDIIGFTYENYIERRTRNRKGHFLTPPDVVDTMLDMMDYQGTAILGRKLLDPACGSGSFLVRAARRYRETLIQSLCQQHNISPDSLTIEAQPEVRQLLAQQFIEALTTCFFGMELNPFACYLAEMNLLIQALDDMLVLHQAQGTSPIERFEVYNTDSLSLPQEVVDYDQLHGMPSIPHRLSDHLLDEAYALKAREGVYRQGFFYVIANPPYIARRRETFATEHIRQSPFFRSVLSGDTNTYLLFLRLGLYYLADYGHMVYIVPLTLLGDSSARAARHTMTSEFALHSLIRFYRGDVLFKGVDQSVVIIRLSKTASEPVTRIYGGYTLDEVRESETTVSTQAIIHAVPPDTPWNGSWLVAPNQHTYDIWHHATNVGNNGNYTLDRLLNDTFEWKQGDVNATHLNPFRVGSSHQRGTSGVAAVYKGENISLAAPLPPEPADYAHIPSVPHGSTLQGVGSVLHQIAHISSVEKGIVLRQVARLNTRTRLVATWFERDRIRPTVFTNELWRMLLRSTSTEEQGKAVLAVLVSNTIAYLLNIFSSNNHVNKDDINRIPIPNPQTFPVTHLATYTDMLLTRRANLEMSYVRPYGIELPSTETERLYVSPVAVVTTTTRPTVSLHVLIQRGIVSNSDNPTYRISTLLRRQAIQCTNAALKPVLDLFLQAPSHQDIIWDDAQSWILPDPVAASDWLTDYTTITCQAQTSWQDYCDQLKQIDETVMDWYGFLHPLRDAIRHGVPWATPRRIR